MGVNFPLLSLNGAPTDGVNEVQTVTITGSPNGGTFTLTYDGQTTTAIAFNASASVVEAALQALCNIAADEVLCAGGALPGTAVTVTFRRGLGGQNVPQMTADATNLTGGIAPAVTVTTSTGGVRGSFRGAQESAYLQDIANGILYQNTGDVYVPVWTEYVP